MKLSRSLILIGVVAGCLLLVIILFPHRGSGPRNLPSPNGYDDFLAAGALVVAAAANQSPSIEEQRALVEVNRAALARARAGLGKECAVPLDASQAYLQAHIQELSGLKGLAMAFRSEGRLAEMEGRNADAARSYLDAIRLGRAAAPGGLLIDQLVGLAVEAIGASHLQTLAPQLDAPTCRATAAEILRLEPAREPFEVLRQRERAFMSRVYPWIRLYQRLLLRRQLQDPVEKASLRRDRVAAEVRLLALCLAVRAHHLEKGHWPANLEALRPDYLADLPLDPFTTNAFRYRPTTEGFQLYSVGPDRRDNGGTPTDWKGQSPQGDIVAGTGTSP